LLWNCFAKWIEIWWEAPMEGFVFVLSFLKAERKVSDTGSAHWASSFCSALDMQFIFLHHTEEINHFLIASYICMIILIKIMIVITIEHTWPKSRVIFLYRLTFVVHTFFMHGFKQCRHFNQNLQKLLNQLEPNLVGMVLMRRRFRFTYWY
jgi:hypothetical protein